MSTGVHGALSSLAVGAVLPVVLALGVAGPVQAGEGRWTLELEPVSTQVYGHDQHVLTIHTIDLDSTPRVEAKEAVRLDTDDAFAYRGELRYTRGQWGLGLDFFWFVTTQNAAPRTARADGASGPIDQVVFEVADRAFTSSNPGQVLFYRLLEDTDLEFWTVDLYAIKTLAETPKSAIRVQVGLKVGDFDNDYRAVVGIEGAGGLRMDASSNYDRMMGPLVALAGSFQRGRSTFEGYVGQSVLLGTAEKLVGMSREFTGPFSETPAFFSTETIRQEQVDVAIPLTELRIKWTVRLTELFSLVVGTQAAAWWDVSVPPGVVPGADGDEAFHENTIVSFGLLGGVKLTL
jgi:hypothetical protein